MTPFQRALVALAVVALLLAGWFFRYEAVAGARVPFVLDRWTGNIHIGMPVDR